MGDQYRRTSEETERPTGSNPRLGKPNNQPRYRDQNRMRTYNEARQADDASWSERAPVPVRDRDQRERNARGFQQRQQSKGQKSQNKQTKPKDEKKEGPPPLVETPPVNDPLIINEINGSIPDNLIYSQNMDMSHFPLICEEIFNIIEVEDPKVRRELPYCVFLHGMNTLTQMHMQETARKNGDARFNHESPLDVIPPDFTYPSVIDEYIKEICNTNTVSGDKVYFNLPTAGTPRGPIIELAMESGTFGSVVAGTHNAYECYVSPFVTAQLIRETFRVNAEPRPNPQPWNPFAAGQFPVGAVPNRNLLGYQLPELLQLEGRQRIANIEFLNDDTVLGRLKYSPVVMNMINNTMKRLSRKLKMVQKKPSSTELPGLISFLDRDRALANTDRLVMYTSPSRSIDSISGQRASRDMLFGQRRNRRLEARGLCYTVNGNAPNGWNAHINDNFNMAGEYGPRNGVQNNVILRMNRHTSYSTQGFITTHMNTVFSTSLKL